MLLTRKTKPGSKTITASITAIQELPGKIVLKFGAYTLSIKLNDNTITALSEIAYLGGIEEDQEVELTQLLGLKMRITIENNRIKKITHGK